MAKKILAVVMAVVIIKSNYLSVALLGSQDISLIFVNVQDE